MSKVDYTKKIAILRQHREVIWDMLEEVLYAECVTAAHHSLAEDLNLRLDEDTNEVIDLQA